MRLATLAMSACLLAFAGAAPTVAAPVSGAGSANVQSEAAATQVQYSPYKKKGNYKYNKYNKGKNYGGFRQGYRAGSRHAHAPKGWHRHSYRPSYWQTRGCIMVGPVWFCP